MQKTHQMTVEKTTVSPFKKFYNEYRLPLIVLFNFKYQLTTTACIPQEGKYRASVRGLSGPDWPVGMSVGYC